MSSSPTLYHQESKKPNTLDNKDKWNDENKASAEFECFNMF